MKLIHLLGIGFILFASCNNLFDEPEINQNPNEVNDVDARTLLSGTELGMGYLHQDTDVRIAALWARQINGLARAHRGYSQYIVSSTNFEWEELYPVAGQARLLQEKAIELGERRIQGIGQTLEVLILAKASSLWGDVPYSQAFQAVEFPVPDYDAQREVYDQMINTLDEAIDNLSAETGLSLDDNDFFYGGDNELWIGAANTLKARLHLHLGQYVEAIDAAQNGIGSNEGDLLMPHGTSQGVDINLNHDFFAITRPGDTGFDGAYLPDLLQSRIGSGNTKTDETALFDHIAAENLTDQNSLDPNTINGAFVPDAPHPILTYYENQLTLAEALARTNQLEEALSALNSVRVGLRSGYFNGLTMPESGRRYEDYVLDDFNQNGLANPNEFSDTQRALLYEIIAQRYIVLLMQYEAFNDYRRVGVAEPIVELPIPLSTGDRRPQRFIYPQEQVNTNPNTPNPLPDQFLPVTIFE